LSSCGTLFDITKKETEQEKWDRIINQAWEETISSKNSDYLFKDVSLSVDTVSTK
jgi:hypothetical protein